MFEANKARRDLDTAPKAELKQEEIPTEGEEVKLGMEGSPMAAEKLMEEIDQKQKVNEQLVDSLGGAKAVEEAITALPDPKKQAIMDSIAKWGAKGDQAAEDAYKAKFLKNTSDVSNGWYNMKQVLLYNPMKAINEWRLKRHEAKMANQPAMATEASVAERGPQMKEKLLEEVSEKRTVNQELVKSLGGEEAVKQTIETLPEEKKESMIGKVKDWWKEKARANDYVIDHHVTYAYDDATIGFANLKAWLVLDPGLKVLEWAAKKAEAKK